MIGRAACAHQSGPAHTSRNLRLRPGAAGATIALTMHSIRRPDVAELETLVLAADRGSITAAAETLRISRVAASKRLRNLEAVVGKPLLHTTARGIELTPAGREICVLARDAIEASDRLLARGAELHAPGDASAASLDFLIGAGGRSTRERTHAEVLREAQEVLAGVFHRMPVAVFISDTEAVRFIDANPFACRMTGWSREEIAGATRADLDFVVDDRHRQAMLRALSVKNTIFRAPGRLRCKDGTIKEVENTAWPATIAGQEVVFIALADVTDMVATESAMAASEWLVRNAVRPMATARPDGTPIVLNGAWRSLAGIGPDEPPPRLDALLDDPGLRERTLAQGGWEGGARLLRRSAEPVPVHLRSGLVRDAHTGDTETIAVICWPVDDRLLPGSADGSSGAGAPGPGAGAAGAGAPGPGASPGASPAT